MRTENEYLIILVDRYMGAAFKEIEVASTVEEATKMAREKFPATAFEIDAVYCRIM